MNSGHTRGHLTEMLKRKGWRKVSTDANETVLRQFRQYMYIGAALCVLLRAAQADAEIVGMGSTSESSSITAFEIAIDYTVTRIDDMDGSAVLEIGDDVSVRYLVDPFITDARDESNLGHYRDAITEFLMRSDGLNFSVGPREVDVQEASVDFRSSLDPDVVLTFDVAFYTAFPTDYVGISSRFIDLGGSASGNDVLLDNLLKLEDGEYSPFISTIFVTEIGGEDWYHLSLADLSVTRITSVPEPSAFVAFAILALCFLLNFRRRRAVWQSR